MATPEQRDEHRSPFATNQNGYVELARRSGSICYCDSSAPASGSLVFGELRSIVKRRFSSIDLKDQVSRDVSKPVGSGNYGLVREGTIGAENKRVAVNIIRYGALPARKVSRLLVVLVAVMTPEDIQYNLPASNG